jgi:hypothetical protein
LEQLRYFGVAAAIVQAWTILGIYCTVFNACRDFRDTLVALAWWLFFLISLFSERDVVFFFCNFVINVVATVTIIHEKIL